MNVSDFELLKFNVLSHDSTFHDFELLWEWFSRFDICAWNGECFRISACDGLFPIYKNVSENDFEIVGFEVRTI